eukprot:TRINITY_DN1933_c0_g1_i1.p3 TRINITY_DN1933_c0_g1~~TRINITY_DN1933_c0_g1_i1.p3  ORF type:complete len:638 (-),score=168.53 TRINITY_DN1933_c0_g1_i1:2974-4887(-)
MSANKKNPKTEKKPPAKKETVAKIEPKGQSQEPEKPAQDMVQIEEPEKVMEEVKEIQTKPEETNVPLHPLIQLCKDVIKDKEKRSFFEAVESSLRCPLHIQEVAFDGCLILQQSVQSVLEECNKKVRTKLEGSEELVIKVGKPVENTVEEAAEVLVHKNEKIEEEIKKTKLKEILRMKEELQQKLMSLSENEELLHKTSILEGSKKMHKDKEYYMLSKEERKKLRTEFEMKRTEALEFVKKKQAEKRERLKRELEKRKLEEEKRIAEEEVKEKEKAEKNAARKEEMLKALQEAKQKREKELKEQREQFEKSPSPPAYSNQKFEENYRKSVELPLLEAKKKILAEKRNLLKPITKEELEEHEKKLEELAKQREQERVARLQKRKEEEGLFAEQQKRFKTAISEKIHERDVKQKEEEEKRYKERKLLKQKMESYAHLLKEEHPVIPNENKAKELQQMIERLKHPVKERKDVRSQYLPSTLSKIKRASHSAEKEKDGKKPRLEEKRKSGTVSRSQKLEQDTKTVEDLLKPKKEEKAKQLDYLTSLRLKREEKYKISKPNMYDWSADIKNEKISVLEKRERVERKAKMIEEQAKKKEQLYYLKGGPEKNLEMGEYVSDMFLDAIKAKLSILGNMQLYFTYE